MSTKVGIFFGTDTGRTRRIAKTIAQKLGPGAAAPVNINRATAADLAAFPALILGTPTLGDGELPGIASGAQSAGWLEFLPQFNGQDWAGMKVAIFGLGDQEKYPDEFVDAIALLHDQVAACGADVIGDTATEGYRFRASQSVVDNRFLGLALDQVNQAALTEARLDAWLAHIKPLLGL
jgi:flavodoxin I